MTDKKMSLRKIVLTSFFIDVLDLVSSIIIAYFSGSVVMLTQALEGMTDLASSALLVIGLQRSGRKEDPRHPFGYGREIYFWALISALVMLGSTATLSIYFGYQRFIHPEHIKDILWAFIILVITVGTNGYGFFLSFKRLSRGRPLRHILAIFYRSSLVEIKTTFILDLMGTVASLVGILALSIYLVTGDSRYDGLGAIVTGLALLVFGVFLILGIKDLLVGRSASLGVEREIREAALKVREVDTILGIKTVYMGSERLLVALDVNMKSGLTTRELEGLMDRIKAKVREVVPTVKYIQVELETKAEK